MRRGENIRKRQDGRWEARYIASYDLSGKAIYKSVYAPSYSEVKAEKITKEEAIKQEADNLLLNITMDTLCDGWLQEIQIKVKITSYADYYCAVESHIKPYFNNCNIQSITNSDINKMIREKSENGRLDSKGGLSSKSIYVLISIIKQIIEYAEKKKYITNFDYDFIVPKSENNQIKIMTHKEQNRFVLHLKNNMSVEILGFFISLYAGLRIGEVCALKWSDIDFDYNVIHVAKTMQRIKNLDKNAKTKTKIIVCEPKSKTSMRDIPIPSFLLDLLKPYKELYHNNEYVLTGSQKYFIEPRLYEKKFKQYLKESKINEINFHALRHTFATRAIENGFDVKSLSEILGHSSVSFTLKQYVHSSMELKRSSMERLAVCY